MSTVELDQPCKARRRPVPHGLPTALGSLLKDSRPDPEKRQGPRGDEQLERHWEAGQASIYWEPMYSAGEALPPLAKGRNETQSKSIHHETEVAHLISNEASQPGQGRCHPAFPHALGQVLDHLLGFAAVQVTISIAHA